MAKGKGSKPNTMLPAKAEPSGEKRRERKLIARNKKAHHNYFIEETYEAGIVLVGNEVKSLRAGKVNMTDCFARIRGTEIFLMNLHISPYTSADTFRAPEPMRTRKLLLHKREIEKLIGKTKEKGYTLIATKIYFWGGKVKVEIGLGRGKKHYDKRETLKRKQTEREMGRVLKSRNK